MDLPNYESQWWGYIYDQMMMGDLQDLVADHLRFYRANLKDVTGPVLECACGTGIFLLSLLQEGHDMYGFDLSASMLAALRAKAAKLGLAGIDRRISVQAMETFRYDRPFDAILIPTNTFLSLPTQEAQIQTLRNIHAHLAPGGKLLMDLRLAGMRDFVEGKIAVEGQWHTWVHPETGRPIRQRMAGGVDFDHQRILDRCFIEYGGETVDFPMTGRWIFKEEFTLLLRLAGFERWEVYGTPNRDPLVLGLEESMSYWIVKPGREVAGR